MLESILTACLPVSSSSPLGTTVSPTPAPLLTGMWKGRLGTSASAAYITIYPAHDGMRKIVVLAPPAPGDEGGSMVFEARAAMLGRNTYLDAREIDDERKAPKAKHVPVLYRINGDGFLVLYLIDEKAARMSIEKGAIAGTVEAGEFGDIRITADPATLDRFFASNAGRALFTRPLGILQRVN
jgi:hypothetical protein